MSMFRQGRAAVGQKGTIAEASEACLIFRCWAAGEHVADCHNTLWSAIDDYGLVFATPADPWTACKAVHFL